MSGRLSHPVPPWPQPVPPRPSVRQVMLDAAGILVTFAVVGTACGFLWERVWSAPEGLAYHHQWLLDGEGLPQDFSGTGLYALIGAGCGLVLGFVLALVFDRDELVALVAITVGAVLAAYLMWVVGTALGPPDPHVVAKTADDFDPIPSDLRVQGKAAFLAFPTSALLGATAVFFLFPYRRRGS